VPSSSRHSTMRRQHESADQRSDRSVRFSVPRDPAPEAPRRPVDHRPARAAQRAEPAGRGRAGCPGPSPRQNTATRSSIASMRPERKNTQSIIDASTRLRSSTVNVGQTSAKTAWSIALPPRRACNSATSAHASSEALAYRVSPSTYRSAPSVARIRSSSRYFVSVSSAARAAASAAAYSSSSCWPVADRSRTCSSTSCSTYVSTMWPITADRSVQVPDECSPRQRYVRALVPSPNVTRSGLSRCLHPAHRNRPASNAGSPLGGAGPRATCAASHVLRSTRAS
jgi:hypothetical protein